LKLYVNPISPNSRKITSVFDHLGLKGEVQVVDFSKGEHRTPEFLALNPNGKIPALTDGDFNLWESNAIMAYLCAQVETPLWPKTNARYDIMRWMDWELAHFGRWISTYAYETFLKGLFGAGDPDEKVMAEAAGFIARFGKVLDDHLANREFLVGDCLTIADFAVASHLSYRVPARLPLDDFGHISAWEARLNEVPAWRNSAPRGG
jgi:glutathione S-transferase